MTNQDKATTVFNRVRARYRSGLKSSNKSYDIEDIAENLKPRRLSSNTRTEQAHKGKSAQAVGFMDAFIAQKIKVGASDSAESGRTLWTMSANIMNCDELAQIACYQAHEEHVDAWYVSFGDFDHAICIIADKKTMELINGDSVAKLKDRSSAIDAFAIDVWLNTLCRVSDYPSQVKQKLDKWTSVGKRIAWAPNNGDDGWAVPNGDYQKSFLGAVISAVDL
ncbi:MAG: hypothetical protein ACRYFY_22970 [Janthinobacterium lividum]